MKCAQCNGTLRKTRGKYNYMESGLPNVVLNNIPVYRCQKCKEMEVEIQCAEELRLLIAGILLFKPINLVGAEARYLRKHMGCTADELAKIMGVTRITVTRWEGRKNSISKTHDKHLRRVYLDKNEGNLRKLPDITRFIKTLPDYLPQQKKPEYKIDSEAWIDSATA